MSHALGRVTVLTLTAGLLALLSATGASAADETVGATFPGASQCGPSPTPFTALQTVEPGSDYRIDAAGVITSWSNQTRAGVETTDLRLKVGRASATTPGSWEIVAQSDPVSAPDDPSAPLLTNPTRISVQAGDVIGASFRSAACFDNPVGYRLVGLDGDVQPGDAPFSAASDFPARLNLAAVVEPDADADGFGDTTQDACPTLASTQAACPQSTTPSPTTTAAPTPGVPGTTTPVTGRGPVLLGPRQTTRKLRVRRVARTDFTPAASTVQIRWYRAGKKIASATRRGYRIKAVDRGRRIKAKVTVTSSVTGATRVYVLRTKKIPR